MEKAFPRFEHFGVIGDAAGRKKIAHAIYSELAFNRREVEHLTALETEQFQTALQKILANPSMKELCSKSLDLASQVTEEILDFVNTTKRDMRTATAPNQAEIECFDSFQQIAPQDFETNWKSTAEVLLEHYDRKSIDVKFYEAEFLESLGKKQQQKSKKETVQKENVKTKSKDSSKTFPSLKTHLTDRWKALLQKKELAWQLDQIEKARAKFVKDLYRRIEEIKKLQEALEPFNQQLGRLWDMSKGNWQRVNFDLLKQYAALLNKSEVLQQLAEMLGKMRTAEKSLEEELFKDIELKPIWKVERAQKAELVGIRESDDLSSLLPAETALLSDPELELLFYMRFAEKKLQTYNYIAKVRDFEEIEVEKQRLKSIEDKKGPIIICVDTSGSMHGAPETVAKTLCFALLKIALEERRKCYLISFSTGISTLDLTDFQHSLEKLLDFLAMSFHGGTDAAPALRESLRKLEDEAYKKADVIMISDFVMSGLDEALQSKIKAAKEKETKFHSLVIGASQNKAVIEAFDHNWHYDPSMPDSLRGALKVFREM